MTNEEWNEAIAKEKKARAEAIAMLGQALQKAGVPLLSLDIFERGAEDCIVNARLEGGESWIDISMAAPPMALWIIMQKIMELK